MDVLLSREVRLESRAGGNSSLMVDVERMRPGGHWLGSVLCVSFIALTVLIEWLEGLRRGKRSHLSSEEVLSKNRRRRKGGVADPVHLENGN